MDDKCNYESCETPPRARGFCNAHYSKLRREGLIQPLPNAARKPYTLSRQIERFWDRVEKTENCWLWVGGKNRAGYGRLDFGGKSMLAHRLSWSLEIGEIPEGAFLDHMCHEPSCVNPDHLRLASHTLNMQNRAGARVDSASGVRGVWRDREKGRWVGQVVAFGKKHRKRFKEIEDAERWVAETRSNLYR